LDSTQLVAPQFFQRAHGLQKKNRAQLWEIPRVLDATDFQEKFRAAVNAPLARLA
jgi:hypothetical protein